MWLIRSRHASLKESKGQRASWNDKELKISQFRISCAALFEEQP